MIPKFEFLSPSDKPALLALSNPEWLETARAALEELGFKTHVASTHGDFITSFMQVPYHLVIIEELFSCDNSPENRSLAYVQTASMSLRRHSTVILVGESYTSYNPLQALQLSVHLVVNPAELSLFVHFVQKAIGDNDLFLHTFRETQRRQLESVPTAAP